MGKLVIKHDLVTPEKAKDLMELCPFGAISYEDGKLESGDLVGFIGGSFAHEVGATYMEFTYVP